MRAQLGLRNTWPAYARFIGISVAIVTLLAVVQILFVYGADRFEPRLLAIPSVVGILFGFMLARMHLLRSQTDLLNTFVEATQASSDHEEAIRHLLRVVAEQLRMDGVALYELDPAGMEARRLRHYPPHRASPLSERALREVSALSLEEGRSGTCEELRSRGLDSLPACLETVELPLPDNQRGLLVLYRDDARRKPPDALERRFLQLSADWLSMTLTHMHQREIIATEREQNRREKERAQTTLESIGDAVITTDDHGRIDYANPVASLLLGEPAAQLAKRPLDEVVCLEAESGGDSMSARLESSGQVLAEAGHPAHMRLHTANDQTRPVQLSFTPILNRAADSQASVLVMRDISDLREVMRRLDYQATHDALTGLLNRPAFEACLEDQLRSARTHDTRHTLCYLDLDQFKIINDTRGHTAGDELLRQVSALLPHLLHERDIVARLGGDEFGILMVDRDIEDGRTLAEEIGRELASFRFYWDESTFSVSASLGLVEVSGASESTQLILQQADAACYVVKDTGRNQVRVFRAEDEDLRDRAGELHWVSSIPDAIEQERFELWAQPVRTLADDTDAYFEVLLRLRDSDGQLVRPDTFIPAAERYDLMGQVDRWVVSRTLAYMQQLQAAGCGDLPVMGINLSGSSLNNDAFLVFLQESVAKSGLPGDRLCFEITETAAVRHLQRTARLMTEMRRTGCLFALDDFGSGLSSFSYLKHLPVDYLKIDGDFVRDINTDPVDLAMVRAIHEVGQILGLTTIAEHVENDAIRARLAEVGVTHGQGYGLARPESLAGPVRVHRAGEWATP
ncbi:EAL domain-containing protein [Thioalkalivibrio sp. ALMg13-2]|uniref:EAL domain-containing protein n=1 Tax=Thioalkalivibrio sp. ALMg13-2 TaxID=1158167 RepID=UPI0003768C16|nr:EAL domain-containing protein [Thioalkalivibrio sp. ALMg13-2]